NRGDQLAELCIQLWSGPVARAVDAPGEDEEVVLPAQWANFYQGCIDRLEPFLGVKLVRKTTTILSSEDGTCVVVCLVSREYDGRGYWWTFRSRHEKALALAARSYLALGCGSVDQVLAIPFTDWKPHLEALSQVVRN